MAKSVHPATQLGLFLKKLRLKRKKVLRTFSAELGLSSSGYAEVENGIGNWLRASQVLALCDMMTVPEIHRLEKLLRACERVKPQTFGDVFTREQMTPISIHVNGRLRRPTKKQQKDIVDHVFNPMTAAQVYL